MSVLSAASSPNGLITGVRSANKRPVIIAGAIGMLVIMVLGMVAMDRAENSARINNGEDKEKPTSTVTSTSTTIGDLTKQYGDSGFIAAEDDPVLPPPIEGSLPAVQGGQPVPSGRAGQLPAGGPLKAPQSNPTPDLGLNGSPIEYQQTLEQFTQKKAQLFEAALVADSSIPLPSQRNTQPQSFLDEESDVPARASSPTAQISQSLANLPEGATYAERVAAIERAQAVNGLDASEGDDSAEQGGPVGVDDGFSNRSTDDTWVLKSRLQAPPTPFVVRTGFVVPGVMVSGINSDLPGDIKGQVSQDVYDTATGKYCLIPQGTIAYGKYNSNVAFGQERVQVAWQRLIFPNGHVINIAGMPGADAAGYSGLHDLTDHHWGRIFGAALAMSVISAGYSLSQDNNSSSDDEGKSANTALSEALGQNLGTTGTQLMRKNLQVQPTNLIRPGMRFNIMVQQDMVFTKPYAKCDYRRAEQ